MATNARNQSGRDYQTWQQAAQQQAREKQERNKNYRHEDKIQEYLRNHPSSSWAEAAYKSR